MSERRENERESVQEIEGERRENEREGGRMSARDRGGVRGTPLAHFIHPKSKKRQR